MAQPDLNDLYGKSLLTPRIAYRLWVLSSAYATQPTSTLRKLLPHIASVFHGENEDFYDEVRYALLVLRGRIESGTQPEWLSLTTADDVFLHLIFIEIEERLTSSPEEVVAGEDAYSEAADPIGDFMAAREACLSDHGIERLWEVGEEALLVPGWFFDNGVPRWEPTRWFEDRLD